MPYRRLPKTDQARLRALKQAILHAGEVAFNQQAVNYRTITEAQRFLMTFENQVAQYQANFDSKVSDNKQYRHKVRNARMYISHFIQVLNLAAIRGEIKKAQKELYHLDPHNHILPDLSSEEKLLEWGKNIIEGEQARTSQGGFPIYNPAINKVQVHYDIFREHYTMHKLHAKTHSRSYENIEDMRTQADAIILSIWDQVENFYKDELPYAKLQKCQAYGMIYYYRTGEAKLTPQTDQQILNGRAQQTKLEWFETEE
ncbi:MAG: hypothetical protein J6R26_07050 [Paludibacteraceae bacterium]|nr:hypothetical protein [Paludibacteraceae bacterium]